MSDTPQVQHKVELKRFEVVIHGQTAHLDYQLENSSMNIHHTFVPVELRGNNLAAMLAKAAFDYAKAEDLRIIPSCSYIAAYAARNPEAAALL